MQFNNYVKLNKLKLLIMKKSISISGILCANLMMFGSMFKVMHWPGANVMLIFAVLLFCFVFLPMALVNNYKRQEEDKKYFALHVTTFFVFFIGIMGVLFKIMHWPCASIFLIVGIPLPFVAFLPVYLYQTRKEKKETLNYSGIMFGLIFLAVFSVLLALNVSRNILENSAKNLINNTEFIQCMETKLNVVSSENPIKKQSDELYSYVEALKTELLTRTNNASALNNKNSVYQIEHMDNKQVTQEVLFGGPNGIAMKDLKSKLDAYKKTLLATEKINGDLKKLINDLFDVSDQKTNDEESELVSWEGRNFKGYQLILVLDVLTQIQANLRLLESEVLALKLGK